MARIRKDLIGSVLVPHPKTGEPLALLAGDKIPKGVEVGDHVLEPKSTNEPENPTTDKKTGEPAGSDPSNGGNPSPASALTPPPKAGAGSGAPAWRTYALEAAAAHGLSIDIPEGATRSEIVDALTAVQIPTE